MNGNPGGYGYGYNQPYGWAPQPYQKPKNNLSDLIVGVFLGLLYPLIHIALMYGVQLTVIAVLAVGMAFNMQGEPNAAEISKQLYEKLLPMAEMLSAISNILTVITVLLIYFFVMRARQREGKAITSPKEYFSLKPVSPTLLLKIVLTTFFLYFAVSGFLVLVELAFPDLMQEYTDSSELIDGSTNWFWSFVATVIMAPLCEELIYRNCAISQMRKKISPVWAIAITSVVFGLVHGSFIWMCYAAALGFVFGFLFVRSDSIFPSLTAHFVFNLIGFFHSLVIKAIEGSELGIQIFGIVSMVLMLSSVVGTPLTLIWVFRSMPKKMETPTGNPASEEGFGQSAPTEGAQTPPPGGYPYGNPYGGNPYGGNPYGGNPYGGNPYGSYGAGQSPCGQSSQPYGVPYGYDPRNMPPTSGRWVFYPGYGWYFLATPTPNPEKTPEDTDSSYDREKAAPPEAVKEDTAKSDATDTDGNLPDTETVTDSDTKQE